MRLLEAILDLTQRELAKELGLSVGRINYCLKAYGQGAGEDEKLRYF